MLRLLRAEAARSLIPSRSTLTRANRHLCFINITIDQGVTVRLDFHRHAGTFISLDRLINLLFLRSSLEASRAQFEMIIDEMETLVDASDLFITNSPHLTLQNKGEAGCRNRKNMTCKNYLISDIVLGTAPSGILPDMV